jgi:hypothetical protein
MLTQHARMTLTSWRERPPEEGLAETKARGNIST